MKADILTYYQQPQSVSCQRHVRMSHVPDKNVLLTESDWGGARTGRSDQDPAGRRPAGGAEQGTDQAAASRAGIGDNRKAGAATAVRFEGERRQSGHPRTAWAGIEAEDQTGRAREDRRHTFHIGASFG
jgi:hypothetical protein